MNNIDHQATINIGTIGHVAHGKSTIVKAISGVKTVRFKDEMVRNITIKLGYANAKIYKCNDEKCPRPANYKSTGSDVMDVQICHCGSEMSLMRHVSFVDCPGHGVLMSTMLNGTSVMDAALLVISANEEFPQEQTLEHISAIEISNINSVLVVQNKIDLVKESDVIQQYDKFKEFVENGCLKSLKNSPIIPVSAQLSYNIDVLLEYIVTKIPIPTRDLQSPARMYIIRSFDINHPGKHFEELKGGICGGSILRGIFKIGDEIEIRPGIVIRNDKNDCFQCIPIISKIVSLFSENNSLEYAIPGGLIGIGTTIDPSITIGDKLVGQLIGIRGTLPFIYYKIEIQIMINSNQKNIKKDETLMININSTTTSGRIMSIENDRAKILLNYPICVEMGDKISLSRRINKKYRLIGHGSIIRGVKADF